MTLPHPFRDRREQRVREAEAVHAKVTIARDGRGKAVASK
jgi:hypothetical protein